ncbi:MAG: hypothetical protein Q9159_003057 [Coniocarpon cinnabarinum]
MTAPVRTRRSFIPITLEQLARERGVLLTDHKTPCNDVTITEKGPNVQCVVSVLGIEVNTASFAMYTFSVSVLLQALLIISMSGAADHGHYRKVLLLTFAFVGAIFTMAFLPVNASVFGLGALSAIISNMCFGASFVLLNSFLPLLVRHHPDAQRKPTPKIIRTHPSGDANAEGDANHIDLLDSSSSALLGDQDANEADDDDEDSLSHEDPAKVTVLTSRMSANGVGIGYIAAFAVQILAMLLVASLHGSLFSLRLVLFFIGAWWFAFTVPTALWLRDRPGPPLVLATKNVSHLRIWSAYIAHSWKSLGKTIARARQLKDVLLFLGAWFLLSDAMATVSGTAVLFAKTTLRMKPTALALINVVVMLSGVGGAFAWRIVERRFHLSPMQTILTCLALFATIPIYALLGFIESFPLGLKNPWEMYPVALVYGLILGGLSSYCRSTYGLLIPPGSEAAFYALYAVTDKGSSVLGPAVVGAITDRFGDIRPSFLFLTVLIVLPGFILVGVNVERGRAEGAKLATVVGGHHKHARDEGNAAGDSSVLDD